MHTPNSSNKGTVYRYKSQVELNTNQQDKVLKVLMLEDNENDADLIRMYLNSSALNVKPTLVSTKEEYLEIIHNNDFDVILSDHNLPQFSSLEALRIRNKYKFHIPFIVVSGAIPEEYAVALLQEGANDYILKDRPQRLVTAIKEAIKKQKTLSDKILAEQELRKINERLNLVSKATADAIWDWDIVTNKVDRGVGFQKLFGYDFDEDNLDLNLWTENIHPDDLVRVKKGMEKFLNSKRTNWKDEFRYRRADGTWATVLDKGTVLRDENGKPYRMVGAVQDITQVRQLELDIIEQNLLHQIQNTQIAIQSQEEERKHIGKELHDNINQLLAFAKMMLDTARNSPEMHDECLHKTHEGIIMAIEEVRKLSHALIPPTFTDDKKFIDAVNELVDNINLSGKIDVTVNISPTVEFKLPGEKVKLTFYRIIQEQLNNILKYSKAEMAEININASKDFYQLEIRDNGVGFDCKIKGKGIGLRNIASRVEGHSGNMKIISAPGEGCIIKVEIPL